MLAATLRLSPLVDLFTRQARHHADAVAVSCGDEELTYAELDRRSNRLAHRLRRAGVGPESQVALAMERGVHRIVALLAIVKAGGAYVPLDADYPAERLAHMLSVTGAGLLLSQRRESGELEGAGLPTLYPFEDGEGGDLPADEPPAVGLHRDQLAYVNFTSGSTGLPKGVAVPQRAVIRLAAPLGDPEVESFASLGPGDVVLQLAPLSFDAATFEVWGALLNGARLEVFPPGKPSLAELARGIRERGVTTLWLTAGLFHQMVDSHPEAFAGVRQLLAGGDVLSAPHVAAALAAVDRDGDGPSRVVNGYGPTENTTFTTCHVMGAARADDFDADAPVPIGRPIPHTRVVLLDDEGRPTDGEGELAAGGDGLARGYLGRPAETALRFVPDPTAGRDGDRLYRTGDRARRRDDGVYDFLGRLDDQLKVRGFRVEPGEIEAALGAHPAVGQAAVLAVPGVAQSGVAQSGVAQSGAAASGDVAAVEKRLVAYVAAERAAAPGPELRRFLADRLPDWMMPGAFVHLDELPLNPNGKVDRRALAAIEPGAERPEVTTPFVAPRNDLERRVAAVFAEMLGLDEVGVDDDLFELGGHSLALTRVVNRLRELFGVELPIAAMFESPTVAAAAGLIESGEPAAAADSTSDVMPPRPEPRPTEGTWEPPLAFPQRRIWFLQRLDPDSLAYNFQGRLDFDGDLDVAALHGALEDIVGRHEAFRTTFPAREGEPVQVIHPPPGPDSTWRVRLPRVDLAALPAGRRDAEARRRMESIYKRPYDMARLPLVYWVLFRLAADRHQCLHAEHHLIHDGWSFNVFLEDFAAFYAARVEDGDSGLDPLPVQFADFAVWQHRWDGSDDYHRQVDYWRHQLAGDIDELDLPTDHPIPARQTFVGRVLRRPLPAQLTGRLRSLARSEGSSLFITLLTAYFALLHRYSGQTGFCVGTGIANRRFKELERLVGMVINTVVLRGDLDGDPSFRTALASIGKVARQAYAHQDVPLDRVVEAVSPARDGSRNPLFQTLFSFHDAPLADFEMPGVDMDTLVGLPNGSAKFELNIISILPREQGVGSRRAVDQAIEMLWEYNTDLFEPATVERLFGHYGNLLRGVLENPGLRLSEIPLLDDEERRQIVVERNRTASGYHRDGSLADLLRAAFAEHGGRVAVSGTGADGASVELTYAELEDRAGGLARRLAAHGAGPDRLVALYLERSPDAVVALVAIALAGAAYLPLSPGDPADRLAELVTDAAPVAVLTAAGVEIPAGPLAELPRLTVGDGDGNGGHAAAEPAAAGPDHLAYVMYTSGSTGRPKGVTTPQRAVLRLVSEPDYIELGAEDVVLQLAPLSFDASTLEVWGALAAGGRIEVFPPQQPSLEELGRFIAERGVTTLWLTAGLFHQMVDSHPEAFARVRQLLAGGDVLSVSHVARALAAVGADLPGGGRVVNGYGPTENTTFTACHAMDGGERGDLPEGSVPIGRPVPDTDVYVLDRHLAPVPDGVVGEIWTGGDGLARGYLGRPARTAVSFVPHPFAGRDGVPAGARAYRTGDLGRWRRPGGAGPAELDFVGRQDHQVKVRGFRIEPGEVENRLAQHPGVGHAAVLPVGEAADDKRLVAFVTAADGAAEAPAAADLAAWLEERLPSYMVPGAFLPLATLPRTANDKVDRRALAELAGDAKAASGAEYVAPRNDMEEVLAGIWSELIGVDRVGVHDNFFELGGHSLHATRHMHRVRELLEVEMPLRALYEAPTLEAMAGRVEDALLAELEGLSDEEVARLVD